MPDCTGSTLRDFARHCGGWMCAARHLADIADQCEGAGLSELEDMGRKYRAESLTCLTYALQGQRIGATC